MNTVKENLVQFEVLRVHMHLECALAVVIEMERQNPGVPGWKEVKDELRKALVITEV